MPWNLTDTDAEGTDAIPPAAMTKYYDFRRTVRSGTHPKEAAANSDMNYEKTSGDRHTIRLNQEHRVFFDVSESNKTVYVKKIGTHNYDKWG
ncbi:MAG: hypothetical protein ABI175_01005 [Polyangiales bacterium]